MSPASDATIARGISLRCRRLFRRLDRYPPGTIVPVSLFAQLQQQRKMMGIQMAITARAAEAGDRADEERSKSSQLFGEIANSTSRAAGRAPTFVAAIAIVLIWAIFRHLAGNSTISDRGARISLRLKRLAKRQSD
jgi:hypothetical protein